MYNAKQSLTPPPPFVSLLTDAVRNHPAQPLPIELARQIVAEKPGTYRLEVMNRLFSRLSPSDQLACRSEMEQCRMAKRGLVQAVLSTP